MPEAGEDGRLAGRLPALARTAGDDDGKLGNGAAEDAAIFFLQVLAVGDEAGAGDLSGAAEIFEQRGNFGIGAEALGGVAEVKDEHGLGIHRQGEKPAEPAGEISGGEHFGEDDVVLLRAAGRESTLEVLAETVTSEFLEEVEEDAVAGDPGGRAAAPVGAEDAVHLEAAGDLGVVVLRAENFDIPTDAAGRRRR